MTELLRSPGATGRIDYSSASIGSRAFDLGCSTRTWIYPVTEPPQRRHRNGRTRADERGTAPGEFYASIDFHCLPGIAPDGEGGFWLASEGRSNRLIPHALFSSRCRRGDHRRQILEANLARQIEAIRASDNRISLLVPTTTAMIGILAALLRLAHLSSSATLYSWQVSTVPLIAAYAMMATA